MTPHPKPPTIGQVATAAGVSRATVSRVMNGKSTVSPAIAAQVRAVVDELGYRPNAVAQNLSLGRTRTVAVLVPDLGNPMFQSVLRGVTTAAALDGYRVLVADSEEMAGNEAGIARDARGRCDALVLCAPRMPEPELRALLPALAPVVLVNRLLGSAPEPGADPVVCELAIDYEQAMEDALVHLYELGHTRVAYLAGPPQSSSNLSRQAGIRRVADRLARLTVTELPAGARIDDGYAAAEAILGAGVTAVVAFNDLVAFGLLTRLRERGVDVPSRLSVIGFDDIPFARYAVPSLTTLALPRSSLGTEAWLALKSQIDGGPVAPPRRFAATLVPRASTGPAFS